MAYFKDIVSGMRRTSYITDIAVERVPLCYGVEVDKLAEEVWDYLYSLLENKYVDEYFREKVKGTKRPWSVTIKKGDEIFDEAMAHPDYSKSIIDGDVVILRITKEPDKCVVNGVIYKL